MFGEDSGSCLSKRLSVYLNIYFPCKIYSATRISSIRFLLWTSTGQRYPPIDQEFHNLCRYIEYLSHNVSLRGAFWRRLPAKLENDGMFLYLNTLKFAFVDFQDSERIQTSNHTLWCGDSVEFAITGSEQL